MSNQKPPPVPKPPSFVDLPAAASLETEWHRRQVELLVESLEIFLADREDVYIAGNTGLFFSARQLATNSFRAPDLFVVLDTKRGPRKGWLTWEEDGKVPDLVIELVSEQTAEADWGARKSTFGRVLHVPQYVLFDPTDEGLEGFVLARGGMDYEHLEATDDGALPVPQLGLELVVWNGTYGGLDAAWVRWCTPEGDILPTGAEAAVDAANRVREAERRAQAAERRAEIEASARRRAEARLEELKAQLEKMEGAPKGDDFFEG